MGMQLRSIWRLAAIFSIPVLAVVASNMADLEAGRRQHRAELAVLAAEQAIGEANLLLRLALDAETGERGFVISHDEVFLEPYLAGTERFDDVYVGLVAHASSEEQRRRLGQGRRLFGNWHSSVAEPVIAHTRHGAFAEAEALVASGAGKRLVDRMRVLIDEFIAAEEVQLRLVLEQVQRTRRVATLTRLASAALVLVALGLAFVTVVRFARRAAVVADAAARLAAGERGTRVTISHDDEVAVLGRAFNEMATELERRAREDEHIGRLHDALHASLSFAEASEAIQQLARHVFTGDSGQVYLLSASRDQLRWLAGWGPHGEDARPPLAPEECWALRRGRAHVHTESGASLRCAHLEESAEATICVPLAAHGETLGLLVIRPPAADAARIAARTEVMAETLSISLANLRLREALRHQAMRDPLTDCFNRRFMEETLNREVARAMRTKRALAVLMLDVDHFKRFNDRFGHPGGDAVLRDLGALMGRTFRGTDVVCRYGGEEFAVILPDCDAAAAAMRAEELRQAVRTMVVNVDGRPLAAVSISVGVAELAAHDVSGPRLVARADEALYRAKQAGRDRVVLAASAVDVAAVEQAH